MYTNFHIPSFISKFVCFSCRGGRRRAWGDAAPFGTREDSKGSTKEQKWWEHGAKRQSSIYWTGQQINVKIRLYVCLPVDSINGSQNQDKKEGKTFELEGRKQM